jgi:streptomycin 6-kinase
VKLYERHPELTALIPPELYESGRWLAKRLAQQHDSPIVLLHGDLTPSNILDGGAERGLVAVDPAPCLGDAVFDAVDLILWEAHDLKTIEARTEWLAAATGADAERLLGWCAAFAGMTALELASQGDRHRLRRRLSGGALNGRQRTSGRTDRPLSGPNFVRCASVS